jgi:16S rRNA (uracil1498-N3)-methyltransferase
MAARWATIAREAAKQSRRAWLPQIGGPVPVADAALLAQMTQKAQVLRGGCLVLLADESSATPLRDVLPPALTQSCTVVVGPEGGLTPGESEAFTAPGAIPFSLGPQILRTETAALAAAALVLHHAGRLG